MLTQRLFLHFSELQVRVDGVNATSRHRDAADAVVRESTRLLREPRRFRDTSIAQGTASKAFFRAACSVEEGGIRGATVGFMKVSIRIKAGKKHLKVVV